MPQSRKQLAQIAIAEAMKVRKGARYGLKIPISVYDLCKRMGVNVFFQDIPSMEGLYMPDARPKPAIILSSLRPAGRKAMTCGHELGHHVFGHGKQWDELIEDRSKARRFEPEEFQVDMFSAALQMPKIAVSHALAQRKLEADNCQPEAIFALATLFGVSYGALVTHLERTLNLIDMKRAAELSRHQPKDLRESLLGNPCPQDLFVVDLHWQDRAIDVSVGDTVLLPPGIRFEGSCAVVEEESAVRTILKASQPGIGRVSLTSGWAEFIRVTRKDYVGLAVLRFDEEVDDGD